MADILLDAQSFPSTPSSGQMVCWPDSSNKQWVQRDDAGLYLGDQSGAIIAQIASHSADTYYKGLKLPSFGVQPGLVVEWYFDVTKGAAGVAAPIYQVRIGAAGTAADTSRLSITGPAQTAVADTGFVRVMVTVRTVSATGSLRGLVMLEHNLAATGFAATGPAGTAITGATAAAFDNTALGGLFIGLSVNPGASGAWVVEQCLQRIWY